MSTDVFVCVCGIPTLSSADLCLHANPFKTSLLNMIERATLRCMIAADYYLKMNNMQ
jgi:hypothetical protein